MGLREIPAGAAQADADEEADKEGGPQVVATGDRPHGDDLRRGQRPGRPGVRVLRVRAAAAG